MVNLPDHVLTSCKRWVGHGWEWRIIHGLLSRYYNIDLSKTEVKAMVCELTHKRGDNIT